MMKTRTKTRWNRTPLVLAMLLLAAGLVVAPQHAIADEAADKKAEASEKASDSEEKLEKARLAYLPLSGSLPESESMGGIFAELSPSLSNTLNRIAKAAEDDDIHGLVIDLKGLSIGYGQVNELRGAIARFRESGKPVHAYMETGQTADYLVATACSDITMPESGYMIVPGVRTEATFYKGMFDMLGVKADFLHMGEAKGAAEPYTRRSFSKPVRENLTAMVDGMYEHIIDTITNDRPIRRKTVVECVDKGLLTATSAQAHELIDRVAYSDELKAELKKEYEVDELVYVKNYGKKKVDTDFSGTIGMIKLLQMLSGGSTSKSSSGKKIAVIYAEGPIMSGKSTSDIFGASTLGSDTIVSALRTAGADDDVVAIVLRVNSPGGSAVASDMIWREVEALDKPIVASMSDVAASGGYYIAMGCDKIFAEPGTITGSIGVVGGKIALGRVMERVGVDTAIISRGKNSGLFSVTNGFSASEKKVFRDMMEETYAQFTGKAADGRNMPLEKLKSLAGGKVYTGTQAKANGLIDELGTLHDAIKHAKKLAKVKDDEKVRIQTLPEPVDFFESLFGDNEDEKEVKLGLGIEHVAPELAPIARKARLLQQMFREPVVLAMPFDLKVK